MTQEQQKVFYEQGLRPAIAEILSIEVQEWPSSYRDEFWRATGRNGQLRFSTRVVPKDRIHLLADAIRACLLANGVPWHDGLVILHQVRGVKHASSHAPTAFDARDQLRDFMHANTLNYRRLRTAATCYVDVALTVISDDGKCLAWQTTSHFTLVRDILGISHSDALRITSLGSSKYTRDMTSHLPEVSGWRIAPGVRAAGIYDCRYFHGYNTEKALTARQEKGRHAKFLECPDIFKGKADDWIDSLYQLNLNAIDSNLSTARMEVRVPLSNAKRVLLDVDEEVLRFSLIKVHPTVWWSVILYFHLLFSPGLKFVFRGIRAIRILACKLILRWYMEGPSSLQGQSASLVLVAGVVWLLNGLHCAPDKGANSKRLMDALLPHVDREGADPDTLAYGSPTKDDGVDSGDEDMLPAIRRRGDEMQTLPSYAYGMVFFRMICVGRDHPVPRLHNDGSTLHPKAFAYFFKGPMEEVRNDILSSQIRQPANPNRVSNKTRRTPIYFDYAAAEDNAFVRPVEFNFAAQGCHLQPTPVDMGPDAEPLEEVVPDEEDIDVALTNLWYQFALDITSRSSNCKGGHTDSHVILDTEARLHVTPDTYKNRNLAAYFRDCQWKVVTELEWRGIFDLLFPMPGHKLSPNAQNYTQMRYYLDWTGILQRTIPDVIFQMRTALKKKFDEFYWMPYACKDRVWKSRYMASYTKSSGLDRRAPCPVIAIAPRSQPPLWTPVA
jgi:hypothetical protein